MTLCPLTGLPCLSSFCGGSDGTGCPIAPPYGNPLARDGFADAGALAACAIPAHLAGPQAVLALAQLAGAGLAPRAGPGLIAATLAYRVVRHEILCRPTVIAQEQHAAEMQRIRVAQQAARALEEARRQAEEGARQALEELRRQAEEEARQEAVRRAQAKRLALQTAAPVLGERIGWRIWWLYAPAIELHSFSARKIWMPGEPMTGKPTPANQEGVWAFKERSWAVDKACYSMPLQRSRGGLTIFGAVKLWGGVIEHEIGWRGQFARIVSLDGVGRRPAPQLKQHQRERHYSRTRRQLNALRRHYGVGSFADYQRRLRREGPQQPAEWIDEEP